MLILAIPLTLYFAYIWFKNDNSGESIFAFFSGLLIPFLLYLKNKKNDTFNIAINEKSFINKKFNVKISFPKVIYSDNTLIENKINSLIESIFLRHHIDIKNKKILDDTIGEFESSFEKTYKIKNILGFKFTNFMYYNGAAHGNVEIVSLNINLYNGEEFEFKDIFRGKYQNNILNMVKDKLKKHRCKDSYFDFDSIQLNSTQEFYISEDNLVIVFFKYEIAPGACGPIEIRLKLDKISPYINPNGPLFFLYSKFEQSYVEKGHSILYALNAYEKLSNKSLDDE